MDNEVDNLIKTLEYEVEEVDSYIAKLQYIKKFYLTKIEKLKRG